MYLFVQRLWPYDIKPAAVVPPGGLGEAVCSAIVNEAGLTVNRLAVVHVPRSGKPAELLKIFGIDRDAIMQVAKKMISSSANAK